MNSKYLLKKRRGISQLLAVIITIGIVLAIGAFVFAWSFGLARTGSAIAEATVTDVHLIQTASGDSSFSITIKNTGTVTATSITVTAPSNVNINGTSSTSISFSNLAPGKSASAVVDAHGVQVGKSYIFDVVVTFADGSQKAFPVSVVCEQA